LNEKNGEFESIEGKGRPSKKDAWSVEKIAITLLAIYNKLSCNKKINQGHQFHSL
jgi:hypothetical protein